MPHRVSINPLKTVSNATIAYSVCPEVFEASPEDGVITLTVPLHKTLEGTLRRIIKDAGLTVKGSTNYYNLITLLSSNGNHQLTAG